MVDTTHAVLAVDPGLVSGVALMLPGEEVLAEEYDFNGTCDALETFCKGYAGTDLTVTVVIEDFVITQRTAQLSQAPWSRELIGVARRYSRKHLKQDPVIYKPAQAKSFSTDGKLKALGWWSPTKGGHANDALRHLLVFAAKNALIDISQLAGVR